MPQYRIYGQNIDPSKDTEETVYDKQIDPANAAAYLIARGIGRNPNRNGEAEVKRNFNGMFYMMYWEIYRNYISNRQEGEGCVIAPATVRAGQTPTINSVSFLQTNGVTAEFNKLDEGVFRTAGAMPPNATIIVRGNNLDASNIGIAKMSYINDEWVRVPMAWQGEGEITISTDRTELKWKGITTFETVEVRVS